MVTPLYRQANLQCTNPECGATYAAAFEILYAISPSAIPNPDVHLRQAPPRRRAVPANDEDLRGPEVPLRPAANDDDENGEAVAVGR